MRRWTALLLAGGLLAGGLLAGGLLAAAVAAVAAGPAAAATWPSSLHAGAHLRAGERLVSPDGRFHASVERDGRLVVRAAGGRQVWATPKTGPNASLVLRMNGQLVLTVGGQVRWSGGTRGSGDQDVLRMRNRGILTLNSGQLPVWSSRAPDRCPAVAGKTFVVDLGTQRARLCQGGQQIRTTLVTTGASALGYGTPTGTWHVYARVRDTTLYPAAGGAYPVKYWMPYSGPYGAHDSPWQKFPYGSRVYTTRGSHGCIHVPRRMMAWLFGWAGVGTRVTVHH